MSDNAEEGIMRAQMAQKDGLGSAHKRGADNLGSRASTMFLALAFLVLTVVWATASSPYIIYGSFAVLMLIVVLTGVIRVKRILKLRALRELQMNESQSKPDH